MPAIHTINSIHWMLLRRLLAVWLLVALAVTGIGYYIEVNKFEEGLSAIAASEMRTLSAKVAPDGDKEQQVLAEETKDFIRKHYLWIRVYNHHGRLVRELYNPKYTNLTEALKATISPMPHDGRRHFETRDINGQKVIHILVTLTTSESPSPLYFEGAFLLDQQTQDRQQEKIWRMLAFILFASLATVIAVYPIVLLLYRSLIKASKDILRGNLEIASVLGTAIAKRDSDTGEHNYRVTLYAIRLAEAVNLPMAEMRSLILGAFLHDVGKIGIPDAILLKPGRLSETELAAMRKHVELGLDIVAPSHWLLIARDIIGKHHEKYDGSGYPLGLCGETIPLTARIFAIVDVFDALTSHRPYKVPMPVEDAVSILLKHSGQHFDPALLGQFTRIVADIHAEISAKSEAELAEKLGQLLPDYFLHET